MHHPAPAGDATEVGSPEDILRRAGAVPPRSVFPTVDELAIRMSRVRDLAPDRVAVRRLGTSREGAPIDAYTIGAGRRSILVVGAVHPNEPIGSWTILHLAEQLLTDDGLLEAMDATWHLVPCIDPDGMRRNEGWFGRPGDRTAYAREFFRPAPDAQVEWTFPFHYKAARFDAMLPETRALQAAIDDARPDLYVPLHNGEAGGAYYYLSRSEPGLVDLLHRIPASLGIPLDVGEPEGAHFRRLAPAVFEMGTLEDAYDWMESLGLDPYPPGSGGDASTSYARRYGTFSLIAELPYWTHPDAADLSPAPESYAAVLRETGGALVEAGTALLGILERAAPRLGLDESDPLLHATRTFTPMVAAQGRLQLARAAEPDADRPATVAERFGCIDLVRMFRVRYGGMLVRTLRFARSRGGAGLDPLIAEADGLVEPWLADAARDESEPLPIEAVVGAQYGAILAAASLLARRAG